MIKYLAVVALAVLGEAEEDGVDSHLVDVEEDIRDEESEEADDEHDDGVVVERLVLLLRLSVR